MTYLRTKVRAVGDIVTEQTSADHDGEFEIGTPASKLIFPVLTDISSSFVATAAALSGSAATTTNILTASINTMSGTIAVDINRTIFPKNVGTVQLDGTTPVQYAYASIQANERVVTSYTILSGTTTGYTWDILPGVGLNLTGSSDDKGTVKVQIG
jgi:hypothetical protein